MKFLGRKLRKERRSKEWSQQFVGELVGVTGQTVYLWEKKNLTPRPEKVEVLEQVFGVSLMDGKNE